MKAATRPREKRSVRLLVTEGGRHSHLGLGELPEVLRSGDLLVVNDAATLPASFCGIHERTGLAVEMRLLAARGRKLSDIHEWQAVFFGGGDWRTPTEKREAPPGLREGDRILFNQGLSARLGKTENRVAEIRFVARPGELWRLLYQTAKPIQYSHLRDDLALWDVQTPFAGPPVSLEAPSAALALSWQLVGALEKRGVTVLSLTHAAGVSSTGDAAIDGTLPLPECYEIPFRTAEAVNSAVRESRRVIAVGTSVVRALESSASLDSGGSVRAESRVTALRIEPDFRRKVTSGVLSGFHESGASHLDLLGSFLSRSELETAYNEAKERGYLSHEFGDLHLILGN